MKKAVVEPDEKVRAEQIDQLVAIVTEEVPAYMMVQTADLYAYNNDLVGFQVWNQTNFQAKDFVFQIRKIRGPWQSRAPKKWRKGEFHAAGRRDVLF